MKLKSKAKKIKGVKVKTQIKAGRGEKWEK
jgi:hypothetical protein